VSADLEQRLQLLEDERAIAKQLYAYGQSLDYGLEEPFVDCFTDDAVLSYTWDAANTVTNTGRSGELRFEGREQVAGFVRSHTNAPNVYHKHFVVEPQIEIDGDTATVISYFARLDRSVEGPSSRASAATTTRSSGAPTAPGASGNAVVRSRAASRPS
jgi:hypothetical protein